MVAPQVDVRVASEADREVWDAFASAHTAGYHSWAWREVVQRSFGHECVYLIARCDGRIVGLLPLVFMKSRIFGRSMTSMPFLNYGGVVSDSEPASRALLDTAAAAAIDRACRHVELRHTERQFQDLPSKQHKVAMRLALQPGMWDRIDRKVRNQIRKAQKSDLTVETGGAELIPAFYEVFARNMRDLGTPVYGRRFFEEVVRAFPARTSVLVVRLKGAPVAAGLTYRTSTTIEMPWASSIRDYNSLCPNYLLYWDAIESAVAAGCDVFDFGRSTPHEGTYKFKEQWGAEPVALHWEYRLLNGSGLPDQSPKNPKFQLAIETWKRMPLWLANAVGPHIVRSIP